MNIKIINKYTTGNIKKHELNEFLIEIFKLNSLHLNRMKLYQKIFHFYCVHYDKSSLKTLLHVIYEN